MNLYPYVFALGLMVGGFSSWFVSDNIHSAIQAKTQAEWQTERVTLSSAKAKAEKDAREIEQRMALAVQEQNDEHEYRLKVLDAKHNSAFNKLRKSFAASCRASPVSGDSGPIEVDDGGSEGNGLHDRIIRRIVDRVIIPADTQTEQLISCQGYVRSIIRSR